MNLNKKLWNISLVTEEIWNALKSGVIVSMQHHSGSLHSSITPSNKHKKNPKAQKGIYLINIRVINYKKKILQYSYIYYPSLFFNSIFTYLYEKENDFNFSVWKEPGPYLPIFDKALLHPENDLPLYQNIASKVETNSILYRHYNNLIHEYYNIPDIASLIRFIYKLKVSGSCLSLGKIISLAYDRKYPQLFDEILYKSILDQDLVRERGRGLLLKNIHYTYDLFLERAYKGKEEYYNLNLLNSCLFVVYDVNLFLDVIKKNGFPDINEGRQGGRGEVNELDSFLSSIEVEFLEYLYQNHVYHYKKDENMNHLILPRSKFSVRNLRNISNSYVFNTAEIYNHEYNTDNKEWYNTNKTNNDIIINNQNEDTDNEPS